MKRFSIKALLNRRGESLLEGIVSILVFVVLAAAVTSMIVFSLQISHTSVETAQEAQQRANAHAAGHVPDFEVFNAIMDFGEFPPIAIPVNVYNSGGFASFGPAGAP